MSPWCRDSQDGALLHVLVSPRATRAQIGPLHDGRLKVSVTAPPTNGAANQALIKLLAKALGIRRADIEVRHGRASRRKTLLIRGVDAQTVREKVSL